MTDNEDNLRELWSETELDTALARLNSTVRIDQPALDQARAELMAAAGATAEGSPMSTEQERRSRQWGRLLVSGAAVVAIAAGVLVAQTVSFNGNPPPASAAAAELNAAADKIGASDEPVGPGQYRYVGTHAWWMSTSAVGEGKSFSYLAENLIETWAPAKYRDEWMQRRDVTGKRTWVHGTEAQARAAGIDVDQAGWPEGERRAPCGDFYAADEGKQPCSGTGNWQVPTPDFIAGLPKDPRQFYDRMVKDSEGQGSTPDLEILVFAADFLRAGTVPADVRATLCRALAFVPSLQVTDRAANLDGKVGVAFGVSDGERRQDIIVDVATGRFIGERQVTLKGFEGVPAGTVTEFTSVDTAVVDKIGAAPRK